MQFEPAADQQLWRRDAVGKHCPPTLARTVGEDGANPIEARWATTMRFYNGRPCS